MKVNIGWVLEKAALPLVIGALLLATFIVLWRLNSPGFQLSIGFVISAVVALLALVIGVVRAWGRFERQEDTIVRLETSLGLNAVLSSAQAQKSNWPAPISGIKFPLRWEYKRVLLPIFGFVILALTALLVPVPAVSTSVPVPAPRAWQNLNQQLNDLQEEELVDEEYIEEMQKKLQQLEAQPKEDWYNHSSLEAGESLIKQHQKEVNQMDKALEKAGNALDALTSPEAQKMSDSQREGLQNQLNAAAEALQNGQLKPNKELQEQLEGYAKDAMKGMSPEQMEDLKKGMKELQDQLDSQKGEGEGEGNGDGDGDGENSGQSGNKNNKRKGPQDPDKFGSSQEEDGPTNRELGTLADEMEGKNAVPLESRDLSKSLPGELYDISQGEHEVDLSTTSQSSGGNTSNAGTGGAATFKGNYLPEEKRALKNFFKE